MKSFVAKVADLPARMMPKHEFMENFSTDKEKREVTRIFEQLGLPIPETGNFLPGTEGGLIFDTHDGIVVRVERKNAFSSSPSMIHQVMCEALNLDYTIVEKYLRDVIPKRIVNDHILQPIASIETENFVVEVVPGVKLGVSSQDVQKMTAKLRKEGIEFWDGITVNNPMANPMIKQMVNALNQQVADSMGDNPVLFDQGSANSAYLPIKTIEFPNGIPVIADRLAAGYVPIFQDSGSPLSKLFGKQKEPSAPLQDKLYGPLKKAFREAWSDTSKNADPEKMRAFWEKCHQLTQHGHTSEVNEPVLTAGWASKVASGQITKRSMAEQAAAGYSGQLGR